MKDVSSTELLLEELVGLRPKMYSILGTENNKPVEKKTAKGIEKSTTKRNLRHTSYRECLLKKGRTITSLNQIGSDSHQIYFITLNKMCLSPYDDKRYILNNGVDIIK